jgi:hypothetical protein
MDAETEKHFVAHVKELERLAISGDHSAVKSLACMALLADGFSPSNPDGGGEVIDFLERHPLSILQLKAA